MADKKTPKDNVSLVLEGMMLPSTSSAWEKEGRAVYTVESMRDEINKLLPPPQPPGANKKSK